MSRLLVVLSAVLLMAILAIGWMLGPGLDQRFVPGVWVWNTSLPLQQPDIVLLGPEGQRWAFSPADLGISINSEATLAQAYEPGHKTAGERVFSERLNIMILISHGVRWRPSGRSWRALSEMHQCSFRVHRSS